MTEQNCRSGTSSERSRIASTWVWPSPKTLLTLPNRRIALRSYGTRAHGSLGVTSLMELLRHEVQPGEIASDSHVGLEQQEPRHEHGLSTLLEQRAPFR